MYYDVIGIVFQWLNSFNEKKIKEFKILNMLGERKNIYLLLQ